MADKKKIWQTIIIITFATAFLSFYVIDYTQKDKDLEGFNDEYFLYCTHSDLFSCEQLEKAYYLCLNAMQSFDEKNCSYHDNKTQLERILDERRIN